MSDEQLPTNKQKTELSFIEPNQLTPTLKRLKKLGKASLDFLEEQLANPELDVKDKIAVARFIIDKQVQVSDSVTKDQMSRLIAEVKVKGLAANPKLRTVGEENNGVTPQAVFTTNILSVEKTSEDYEPPEEGQFDASDWKTI